MVRAAAPPTQCHVNHTDANHGPDHDYDASSGYTQTADTVGSEAGCTNSGAGCHASAATGNAIDTFHTASQPGCTTTDACHSDPDFSTLAAGTTANCSRCHGGHGCRRRRQHPALRGASAGHYGETTHTATT